MNLAGYLSRIGCEGKVCPTLDSLRAVHRAHATSIPFENLDIQLGLPIELHPAALEDKMVRRARGGYCFEHNTLAMHALRAIGFDVTPCEARVRLGATRVAPRTHMVLVVPVAGSEGPEVRASEGQWLWDTGFGGDTPLEPVRMDGAVSAQGGASYRVAREERLFVLQMHAGSRWNDLYAFLPEAREPVDFEVGNWYTSTHPTSHFVTTLTAQLRTTTGSKVLRNLNYTVTSEGEATERDIAPDELLPLLRSEFGLNFPAGTTFRALGGESRV